MSVTLNSNALFASYAELNTIMGMTLTDTDYSKWLINIVSDFVAKYTKRTLKKVTYTAKTIDGHGSYYMYLDQYPIVSITSLQRWDTIANVVAATYVVNTDYLFDTDKGWIYLREGWATGTQNYHITYDGGFTALPSDLVYAAASMCFWIDQQKKRVGIKSETMGDYSYQLDKGNGQFAMFMGSPVPSEIMFVLDQYRRHSII